MNIAWQSLPSGAVGIWKASDYEASPRRRIKNSVAAFTAADPNLLSAPRRLFTTAYWARPGVYTATDNNGTAPDGSNDATSVVVTAGNDWAFNTNPTNISFPDGTYTLAMSVKWISGATQFTFGNANTGLLTKTATASWSRVAVTFTVSGGVGAQVTFGSVDHTSATSLLICDCQLFSGSSDLNVNALTAAPASVQNLDMVIGLSNIDNASIISGGLFQNGSRGLIQFPTRQTPTAFSLVYLAQRSAVGTDSSWQTVICDASTETSFSQEMFSVGPYTSGPGTYYNNTHLDLAASGEGQVSGDLFVKTGAGSYVGASRYDGTTASTFANGVKLFNHAVTVTPPTLSDFSVGVAAGNLFSGHDIYALAYYNRALSDAEMIQAYHALSKLSAPTNPRTLAFEGTSLTAGQAGLSFAFVAAPNLVPSVHGVVFGTSGAMLSDMVTRASLLDAIINPLLPQTYILSVEAGANDLGFRAGGNGPYVGNPSGFTTALASYLDARRAAGWKVIMNTIITRTDGADGGTQFDLDRATANTTIRSWVGSHCDAVADVASDAVIGINGASNNLTYFSSDKVHPINSGYVLWEPYLRTAINGLP